nr:FecR domain-containing protein [Fodinibius salsisoli]
MYKVAAVLLVGAFVGFAAYIFQESNQVKQEVAVHTVTTDYGETKTLNLSDGSQIILAANSQLSFKENWLEQPTKRLSLDGEAFFAVAPKKAKTHPKLEVETEDGTASVWGTRFTVDTYVEGTRVVLEEGEVEVRTIQDKRMTMNPGEMATFQKESSEIQLQKVNPRVYTSWSTNELFFDDTPLSVLVNRIKRTYGVKVKVQNPEILRKKLSGSVDFKSLDGLTDAVAKIFDIQIEQSEDGLIINNNKKG